MVQAAQAATDTNFTQEELDEARRYPLVIRWSDEDGVFLVSLPDFGGATLHADTVGKAAERGLELVAELIDIDRRQGRSIPAPGTVREFVIL
jgi:antitoxin HicB